MVNAVSHVFRSGNQFVQSVFDDRDRLTRVITTLAFPAFTGVAAYAAFYGAPLLFTATAGTGALLFGALFLIARKPCPKQVSQAQPESLAKIKSLTLANEGYLTQIKNLEAANKVLTGQLTRTESALDETKNGKEACEQMNRELHAKVQELRKGKSSSESEKRTRKHKKKSDGVA